MVPMGPLQAWWVSPSWQIGVTWDAYKQADLSGRW